MHYCLCENGHFAEYWSYEECQIHMGNNMCKKLRSAAPLRESKALLVLLKNISSFKSLFLVFTTCVDADLKDLVE